MCEQNLAFVVLYLILEVLQYPIDTGSYRERCMAKLLIAICLTIALVLGIGGCGEAKPGPQPLRREIAPRIASSVDRPGEPNEPTPPKTVASEPNDSSTDAPAALTTQAEEPAPPRIEEPAPPRIEETATDEGPRDEPNTPSWPEATPALGPEPATGEPNQVDAGEIHESEPNAPTIVEPTDSTPKPEETPPTAETVPGVPDPLASFYQEYAEILQEHVRKDGRVDYASLRRQRLRLKRLLNTPDELDPNVYEGWSKEEKLAFWINTYNLKTLEIIARNYPIQSSWWLRLTWPPSDIRHIGGIWSDYRFIVMDEEFTLGDVERRLFARVLADPRAYLATTYASRSSPPLSLTPYHGAGLDRQLDAQVKAFLASRNGLRIDRDKGIVYLSALFKPSWRGKDFVERYATNKKFKDRPTETRAVLNFLIQHISSEDIYFLEVENYTISYMNFDWRLNDGAKRK